MMRLWLDSYTKKSIIASCAALSIVAHALIISAWAYVTLPPPGMPSDGLANRTYPAAYIPPPDHPPGNPGSHESIRYITLAQAGFGNGDGARTMGDERPVTADLSISHAPVDSVEKPEAPAIPGGEDSVFTVIDVDSAVARSENSAAPAYPPAMLSAHVMGFVSARYVVDTTGRADVSSFEVIQSTNPAFEKSVREALPNMRFKPAKIGAVKVRQLVEQTFSFRIDEPVAPTPTSPPRKSGPPGRRHS